MKPFQPFPFLLGTLATLAINASLLAAAPATPMTTQATESPRDYPRELGSAAEVYIEHKNANLKDLPHAKRDRLHPDVDSDQDVEYMFEESEVW